MFLHLGSDTVVSKRDIIAILDLETTSISKRTQKFLEIAQKSGRVVDVSIGDLPKSYILCGKLENYKVYVSPISAQTLHKRAQESSWK